MTQLFRVDIGKIPNVKYLWKSNRTRREFLVHLRWRLHDLIDHSIGCLYICQLRMYNVKWAMIREHYYINGKRESNRQNETLMDLFLFSTRPNTQTVWLMIYHHQPSILTFLRYTHTKTFEIEQTTAKWCNNTKELEKYKIYRCWCIDEFYRFINFIWMKYTRFILLPNNKLAAVCNIGLIWHSPVQHSTKESSMRAIVLLFCRAAVSIRHVTYHSSFLYYVMIYNNSDNEIKSSIVIVPFCVCGDRITPEYISEYYYRWLYNSRVY